MKYTVLVGDIPDEAFDTLSRLPETETVIKLPPDSLIDSPIKSHPDTILCIHGGKLYCHNLYARENEELLLDICRKGNLTLSPQEGERNGKYPFDCAFNALNMGERILGRKQSLCPPLSDICINVNQGYAACCALYAGDTVISADPAIIKVCKAHGITVFPVAGGDILLPGYNTGFIGGAGGFCENRIFIFGESDGITGHALSLFCREKGFELISLCRGILTDYGGIKFIPTA